MKQQTRIEYLYRAMLLWLQPYLVSPVGAPTWPWRFITVATARRSPKLVSWNRYPRQVIGIGIRLPDMENRWVTGPHQPPPIHPMLSILWSRPHASRRWF